jgi:hypothetical protein
MTHVASEPVSATGALDAANDRRRRAPAGGAGPAADRKAAATTPGTFAADLEAARRARDAHLRRLWQMTIDQRVAAMHRGELTLRQLAAWSGRHPEQVPKLNREFYWIAINTPELCEGND